MNNKFAIKAMYEALYPLADDILVEVRDKDSNRTTYEVTVTRKYHTKTTYKRYVISVGEALLEEYTMDKAV